MYMLMEIVLIFNLYLNVQWSKDGKSGIHKYRWEKNRKLDARIGTNFPEILSPV